MRRAITTLTVLLAVSSPAQADTITYGMTGQFGSASVEFDLDTVPFRLADVRFGVLDYTYNPRIEVITNKGGTTYYPPVDWLVSYHAPWGVYTSVWITLNNKGMISGYSYYVDDDGDITSGSKNSLEVRECQYCGGPPVQTATVPMTSYQVGDANIVPLPPAIAALLLGLISIFGSRFPGWSGLRRKDSVLPDLLDQTA